MLGSPNLQYMSRSLVTILRWQNFMREKTFAFPVRCNILRPTLRGKASDESKEGGDVVLHQLLLESCGRPLWEYRSEQELLQGLRAALSGMSFVMLVLTSYG